MILPETVAYAIRTYHQHEYPDDGNWDDWHYSFAPVWTVDQYTLLVKYRQGPGQGDLYSKRTFDGLYLFKMDVAELIGALRQDFDQMRVEIIETLDGLQAKKPKPEKTKDDPFNWKQMHIHIPRTTYNLKGNVA